MTQTAVVQLPDGRKAQVQFDSPDQLDAAVNDLVGRSNPAQQAPAQNPLGTASDAFNEPVMNMVTGVAGSAVGGIAGIGKAIYTGIKTGSLDAGLNAGADTVNSVSNALTYQPRTRAGEVGTTVATAPFRAIDYLTDKGGDLARQGAQALGASPEVSGGVGATVKTGLNLLPAGILKGRTKAGVVAEDVRPSVTAPDIAPPARAPGPAAEVPAQAQRAGGLEDVSQEVAPDLVLEQQVRTRQKGETQQAHEARIQRTAEIRAKEFASTKLGIDWNAIPKAIQGTLTEVAKDAASLDKLDAPALARQLQLQSLDVPITRATAGQLTRDPVQLRNEGNVAATKAGEPIRDVHAEQNKIILDNLDVLKGRTRGVANTPEQVGLSVQDQALRAKLELKKKEVSDKYKAAEDAGELQGLVSPARLIQTVNNAVDKTHFTWVDSWLKNNNIISKTEGGANITRKITLKQAESLRQEAVAKAMNGGTDGYQAGKVIAALDQMTEGAGGKLYKEARKARKQQALEFEDQGAVARLVDNKSRTDRSVALEDTWRKTVIGGSLEDLRNVKRSLLTGGDRTTRAAGKQAWRDVRAQTMQFIKDEATKGVALDERGNPNVTPAAMKRAIDKIGKDKMDEVFGPGTAKRVDRLLEAVRTVKTEPPQIHKGSSTLSNVLAFLERGLSKVPVVGDFGSGTIQAAVKLKQMGESGRIVRESQRNPLADAERRSRRNKLAEF